ncbi:MAG: hypothetical protein ACXQTX_04365 [Candidatus Syntropharchaeia archaeon]
MFEDFRWKLVRVIYLEEKDNKQIQKGILTAFNDSFIVLRNREGRAMFISTNSIVSIKELREEVSEVE